MCAQWTHNGNDLADATGPVLALADIMPEQAGVYSVRIQNANGIAMSEEVILTVGIAAIIVDNPDAAVVGPWHTASSSFQIGTNHLAIAPGFGFNYVEFRPQLPRSGAYEVLSRVLAPSSQLAPGLHFVHDRDGIFGRNVSSAAGWGFVGVFSFDAGSSGFVRITDAIARTETTGFADAVLFRYVPAAPSIYLQPQALTVVEGSDAFFTVGVSSDVPVSFQWQRNRNNILGAADPVLSLPAAMLSDAALYRVLVTSSDGAIYSQEVALDVIAATLRWSSQGDRLTLEWESGILQSSPEVTGPYTDVPGALSPWEIDLSEPQRFFRIRDED